MQYWNGKHFPKLITTKQSSLKRCYFCWNSRKEVKTWYSDCWNNNKMVRTGALLSSSIHTWLQFIQHQHKQRPVEGISSIFQSLAESGKLWSNQFLKLMIFLVKNEKWWFTVLNLLKHFIPKLQREFIELNFFWLLKH